MSDYPTLASALIVNDETTDSQKQLGAGEEAVDGDNNAVITVVRSASNPGINDKRPKGQPWINTTTNAIFFSTWSGTGNGTWTQFGTLTSVTAHAATHAPGGTDALPWTGIHGQGLLSARPAASAANAGYLYDATDNGILYRSDGSSWIAVGGTAANNEYRHTQAASSTGWTVNHGLGRYPGSVSTRDSSNRVIHGSVQHVSTSQLVITFGFPLTGEAVVR